VAKRHHFFAMQKPAYQEERNPRATLRLILKMMEIAIEIEIEIEKMETLNKAPTLFFLLP
jgi:hypothetical protein